MGAGAEVQLHPFAKLRAFALPQPFAGERCRSLPASPTAARSRSWQRFTPQARPTDARAKTQAGKTAGACADSAEAPVGAVTPPRPLSGAARFHLLDRFQQLPRQFANFLVVAVAFRQFLNRPLQLPEHPF